MSVIGGSFRDPSGFVFIRAGEIYRQVNVSYGRHYDELMSSGLYGKLVGKGLMVSHEEVAPFEPVDPSCYRMIKPQQIPFVSYPYEWSFNQYRDAALATLRIQKIALSHNMILKDATAYNIQFLNGKPVLIDTLSFERYEEGKPWVAYRQFCQHFLAPLALMKYTDIRLSSLMKSHIDGIPLDLATVLLPFKTRFKPSLVMHLHMHASFQKKYSDRTVNVKEVSMSRFSLESMIDNLRTTVSGLNWEYPDSEWGEYYENTNYSDSSFRSKKDLVADYLGRTGSGMVWDLGANNGEFSRIASARGITTVAFDIDPVAVDKNYLAVKSGGEKCLLPLVLDLTNPSPPLGWDTAERMSFRERGLPDTVMALALVHHLAISNNVPLPRLASFFASLCRYLIIEFIGKEDSQVRILLATREDIFPDYTREGFERAFGALFRIVDSRQVGESSRVLYLLEKK